MNCQICCESLNKTTHKEIECQYCKYSGCRSCIEKYILDNNTVHCMNCKKVFPREFIDSSFTKVFINTTLKKHRENVLLDEQKSLLIDSQPYLLQEIQKRKLNNEIKDLITKKIELEHLLYKINTDICTKTREMNSIVVGDITNTGSTSSNPNEIKRFVRKCPNTNCRGFLNTRWNCDICESSVCKHCNEIINNKLNEDNNRLHVCDPDNVKTVELLNKDTKPCPKCGTFITKIIGGCDQMYCVDCHTAFSWTKGTIDKGVVHNPHYYEWLRSQSINGQIPNTNLNNECGIVNNRNLPGFYTLLRSFQNFSSLTVTPDIQNTFQHIHQAINHIQCTLLRRNNNQIYDRLNLQLRIKYLLNEISEEEWKKSLQINEKELSKKTDFNNIYQMFVDIGIDFFVLIISTLSNNNNSGKFVIIEEFLNNQMIIIKNLVEYFNTNLEKIGKRYSCVYPGIDKDYSWVNNLKTSLRN